MTKSRGINRPKWRPTPKQLEVMRREFATTKTATLAERFGVAYPQVCKLAYRLGLKKDPAWMNGPNGNRFDGRTGMGTRFQKGHVPWIKGRSITNSPETTFKAGNVPHNKRPIGSFRINSSGYLQIKVSETGYPPRDWLMFHRHVWQQAHGEIAASHVVVFRDGQRRTAVDEITLEVLECVPLTELMRRNGLQRFGTEVANLMRARGSLTRAINRKTKEART